MKTIKRVYCAETRANALRAIIARIDGEFDNFSLKHFGPLSADTAADVREIATIALRDTDQEQPGTSQPNSTYGPHNEAEIAP